MTEHTPGPWGAIAHGKIITTTSARVTVATTHGGFATDTQEANGRLIAAAPDLLSAVEMLLRFTIDDDRGHGIELTEGELEAEAIAIAAIAKATT